MSESGQRVAVVTGGARGIGAAICRQLAADGAAVAVLDLRESDCKETVDAINTAGGKAAAYGADVSDAAQVQAAVEKVASELGPPVILVNNAGFTKDNLLFKMTPEDWDAVMGVHLKGPFLMTKACQKYMVDAQWGRVINLSSLAAIGNRGQANYSAAKAGVQGFTKTLSIELGKFNVTVNAVAPGFVATPMTQATAERIGVPFDKFLESIAKQTPLGRAGQPEDIAPLVGFLAGDGASFISGQIIYVAGGPAGHV